MNGLWRGVWGAAFSSPSSCFSSSSSSLRPSSSLSASPSVLSFGVASSSCSFQHQWLAGGAISAPWFSQFTCSAFFSSSASSCAAASANDPTIEEILESKPHLLRPVLKGRYPKTLSLCEFDIESTNALKALKKAKYTAVADGTGFGFLETEEPFFSHVASSKVLFVREFYPRLFAHIRRNRWVVLIGNPGISKSVFQAYYIHQLLQPGPLPPNHFKSTAPPKVVLRQEGLVKMRVMFLEEELVFTVEQPRISLVEAFNPETTEYLVEPGGDKFEPFFVGLTLPIRLSCAPDVNRYKEFNKNGGAKVYMPCWSLEELQLAGQVLREKKLTPEEVSFADQDIVQRFQQFGGIIRHVLPASASDLKNSKLVQSDRVDQEAEKIRLLSANPDIEEKDNGRPPVSHFLLQYDVDPETFDRRGMKIASPQIFENLAHTISDKSFIEGCASLRKMFNGELTQKPFQFELMVANGIVRQSFKWHIHEKERQQWQPFQFADLKLRCLATDRTPTFSEMERGLLYRIDDARFPLVDMFFKSADDEVTGIQVTFAASHAKPRSAFEQFREKLQLPSHVRCCVLMVPNLKHADEYARRQPADHLTTRATKEGSPAAAADEERPDSKEGSSDADREAKRQAKADFLQQSKFDINTLRVTLPQAPTLEQIWQSMNFNSI